MGVITVAIVVVVAAVTVITPGQYIIGLLITNSDVINTTS